jgi:tetratricopeptide (TPR) repeat protein
VKGWRTGRGNPARGAGSGRARPRRTGRWLAGRGLLLGVAVALALGMGMTACRDNEPALARGDRLWADSAYDAALAEYRLAMAQRDDDHARARLAHAYARAGRLPEMGSLYRELLPGNPDLADQAVYDFLYVAERARRRGDVYSAAMALNAALAIRPELNPPGLVLPAARFHRQRGETERAEAHYARALLAMPPDSAPLVLYELGGLHEEAGHCDVAVHYFEAFRLQGRQDERRWRTLLGEARWHMGNCSFRLAREARERGSVTDALRHLDTMIDLGEPEHLLDQAYMDQADLLYAIGRFDEALEAYRTVIDRSPARVGPLVERAQRRIDEIRFGPRPDLDLSPGVQPGISAPPPGPS